MHSIAKKRSSQHPSNPGPASFYTMFDFIFSFLPTATTVIWTHDDEDSDSDSPQRKSTPTALPSSYGVPISPDRPPTIRLTASDYEGATLSSDMNRTMDLTSSRAHSLSLSPPPPPSHSSPSPSPSSSFSDSPAPWDSIEFNEFNHTKMKSQSVFNHVMNLVRKPAKTSKNLYQDGWIYILQIPQYRDFVKIGRTTQRMKDRKKQIRGCLHGLEIEEIGCEENTKVFYHERLEKIIFADLFNERYHFYCPCKSNKGSPERKGSMIDSHENDGLTQHGEWFKIDAQEAVRRVEAWRDWMRQKPYEKPRSDYQGELKDNWQRRVDYCENQARLPNDPTARWQMFMSPMYMTSAANRRGDRR